MLEVVEPPRPARRTPPTQHGSPATGVRCLLTSAHHQPMLIAAQQVLSRTKLKLQWMERQERESQLQRGWIFRDLFARSLKEIAVIWLLDFVDETD